MPRPKGERIKTNLMLDPDNFANTQVYLMDTKSQRMKYGALQAIVNRLLRQFFNKMLEPGQDPIALLRAYGVDMESDSPPDSGKDD